MKGFLHSWLDTANIFLNFCYCLSVCTIPTSTGEWRVMVPKELDALVTSCVVIPCSFTHTHGNLPASRQKAIWYLSSNPNHHVYNEDDEDVRDKFKERTKLLGQLGQNNCTLEIKDIKDHDNGPFCLKIDVFQDDAQNTPTDSHSFVNDCVQFKILRMLLNIQNFIDKFHIWSTHHTWLVSTSTLCFIADPPKPRVTPPEAAYEDQLYTLTCSVTHTCPGPFHRPNLTWSRGEEGKVIVMHRELQHGYWEVLSILTLMPSDKDDHSEVTCTAQFNGGRTASTTMTIYLKREVFSLLLGLLNARNQNVHLSFYRKKKQPRHHYSSCGWNRNSGCLWSCLLVHLKEIQVCKTLWTHAWTTSECDTYFFIFGIRRRRISELQNQDGR